VKTTFLDFEQPVAELEAKIEELRFAQDDSALDISEEISRLQKKSQALTREIYGKLTKRQKGPGSEVSPRIGVVRR
jgi:acetyl-CoA carboxylase carboxyl transferase subunit alpha